MKKSTFRLPDVFGIPSSHSFVFGGFVTIHFCHCRKHENTICHDKHKIFNGPVNEFLWFDSSIWKLLVFNVLSMVISGGFLWRILVELCHLWKLFLYEIKFLFCFENLHDFFVFLEIFLEITILWEVKTHSSINLKVCAVCLSVCLPACHNELLPTIPWYSWENCAKIYVSF